MLKLMGKIIFAILRYFFVYLNMCFAIDRVSGFMGCLWFVIMAFPGHTRLKLYYPMPLSVKEGKEE